MSLPQWARNLLGSVAREGSASDTAELAAVAEAPTPVTRERISAYLREHEYRFELDDDGDPTGLWDENQLWFILMGEEDEILQVRGKLRQSFTAANKIEALRAINDWSRDRIWPKVYLREEDEGLSLYAEVSVDLEHGVTDAQLAQQLSCGIATSAMAFEALSESLRLGTSLGDSDPNP